MSNTFSDTYPSAESIAEDNRRAMRKRRPDYVQRRIDYAIQRQRHARTAPPDCGCPLCLADRGELRATLERINRERASGRPLPF